MAAPTKPIPIIEAWSCSKCEGCVSLCPSVFRVSQLTGDIEVVELNYYPKDEVNEAITDCPRDCITWEDGYFEASRCIVTED